MRYEMFFIILALALMVGYRLLTGRINTQGLLLDKITHELSPGRLQMLVATMLVAIYLVAQVFETQSFPQLPQEVIMALGGSHVLYLGGKSYGVLVRKLELAATRIAGRTNR
jgi:hypothetical protein